MWTSTLLELLADLDVAEKAARQAIMRTADAGWIEASRVGRETRWSLTQAGTGPAARGHRADLRLRRRGAPWDGRWLVLTVGVPENNRALRQRLRTQLGWAGLGSANPATWVTPRVDREPEARQVLDELGLLAGSWSFVATAGQIGDERSLARSGLGPRRDRAALRGLPRAGQPPPAAHRPAGAGRPGAAGPGVAAVPAAGPGAAAGAAAARGGAAAGRPRSSASGTRPGRRGPRRRGRSCPPQD